MKWTPPAFFRHRYVPTFGYQSLNVPRQEEPTDQCNLIAVDLAKDVFQVAIARSRGKAHSHLRLTRKKFEQFLAKTDGAIVLFEACGSAHFWGREAAALGHKPLLLPAQFVRKYRLRNKTDRTDTEALLDAYRSERVHPVPVRSIEQQQIQQLHRLREQWKSTRTARINGLRGFLRELGHAIPAGPATAKRQARIILDQDRYHTRPITSSPHSMPLRASGPWYAELMMARSLLAVDQ